MGVVVVTAHGHLGAPEADVLQAVLADLIEGQGNLKVVLDVHDVSGIDGSSLGALAAAVEAATKLGGDLTFADPNQTTIKALEAVGLGDAITLARKCSPRALALSPSGQANPAAQRAAMAQHPARTGPGQQYPESFAAPQEPPDPSA
jgi:anti-anti-sigma factor